MKNIMKPYPFRGLSKEQQIYNYHFIRSRGIVQNVFGILANHLRIFLSPILLLLQNVEILTLACCTLHNFLRDKAPLCYTPPENFDAEHIKKSVATWQQEIEFKFTRKKLTFNEGCWKQQL